MDKAVLHRLLRPSPWRSLGRSDTPPNADPGTGKSHMEIYLNLSGKQTVAQLFEGEPKDAGSPSAPPTPAPAPQGGGN